MHIFYTSLEAPRSGGGGEKNRETEQFAFPTHNMLGMSKTDTWREKRERERETESCFKHCRPHLCVLNKHQEETCDSV